MQPGHIALGETAQRRRLARGKLQQDEPGRRLLHRDRRGRRRLGNHHVRIGAAEAERADPGDPRPVRPVPRVLYHPHRQVRPGDVRVGGVEVELPGQPAVADCQHHLDQPGDPGACLDMADLALYRAEQQGAVRARGPRPGRRPGPGPRSGRRSTCRCRGSRRSPARRPRRRPPPAPHAPRAAATFRSAPSSPLLRPSWFTAEPRTTAQDPVATTQRVGQAFEHHDAAPLGADIAIGRGVEGLAASVRRQHPRLAEGDAQLGRQDQVDAARQGQVALAPGAGCGRPGARATSDDEHAVSTARLGPSRPSM